MDRSRWNVVDPDVVSQYIDVVISKSSQGNYRTDATWAPDQVIWPARGKKVAPYHWDDPLCSPTSQVDRMLQVIDPYLDQQEFLAVDSEQWWSDWVAWNEWRAGRIPKDAVPKLSANQISDSAQAVCEQLRTRTGKKIVEYTRAWFIKEYSPQMLVWLGAFNHWYAQWPYNGTVVYTTWENLLAYYLPGVDNPTFPAGWVDPSWDIWQFTGDKFVLPGCTGAIDLNFVKRSFLDNTTPPPPQPATLTVPAGKNIRVTPNGVDCGDTQAASGLKIVREEDTGGYHWYTVEVSIAQTTGVVKR